MHSLGSKFLKWIIGIIVNLGICLALYFTFFRQGTVKVYDVLLIGGFIQLLLVMPSYLRDIGILPIGSPVQLRGMSRYDVNANPYFFGVRKLFGSEEWPPRRELTGLRWLFFRRTILQKISYAVLMILMGTASYVFIW